MQNERWEADSEAKLVRRWGKSAQELGNTNSAPSCPDIWELSDGNVAMIGRDLTDVYKGSLPEGVSIGDDERLVVLPRNMIVAAKADIPDA